MIHSVRWFGAAALAGLAVLGLLTHEAQAQFRFRPPFPRTVVPVGGFNPALGLAPGRFLNGVPFGGVALNTNPLLADGTSLNQAAYNTAVVGAALSTIPPYALGYNPYPQYGNYGPSYPAISPYASPYASLPTAPAYNPYYGGGYGGATLTNNPYSGSGGYGGYGGSNPSSTTPPSGTTDSYQGYLYGAAAVTSANGQYQVQIQQARLLHEQYRQAAANTRRKIAGEARPERKNRPAAQELHDPDRTRALERARQDPPLTDLLSGRALNDLYRHLASEQGQDRTGPTVDISEDVLKKVNLAPRDSRANVGLLKDDAKLRWPLPLEGKDFEEARTSLQRAIADAVQQVQFNNPVQAGTLKDMNAYLKRLKDTLRGSVADLSPSEYIAAQRYLHQLGDALAALSDPKLSSYFNRNQVAEGRTVGGLVKYMARNGLRFAPAVPGDEAAYAALYHALQAFDARRQLAQK
jgi:hypothetical protein